MRRLRFDAPARHILREGDQTIHGGDDFTVEDDERALDLLTNPHVNVIEAPAGPDPDEHDDAEPEPELAGVEHEDDEVTAAPDPDDQQDEPEAD